MRTIVATRQTDPQFLRRRGVPKYRRETRVTHDVANQRALPLQRRPRHELVQVDGGGGAS